MNTTCHQTEDPLPENGSRKTPPYKSWMYKYVKCELHFSGRNQFMQIIFGMVVCCWHRGLIWIIVLWMISARVWQFDTSLTKPLLLLFFLIRKINILSPAAGWTFGCHRNRRMKKQQKHLKFLLSSALSLRLSEHTSCASTQRLRN